LARVAHPNVVSVHDIGEFGGRVYIDMELIDGVTLSRWLRLSPRTWQDVLGVFIQAGRGLCAAHALGIVHRDFKPDNVIIGDDGRVRVADFGIALLADTLAPDGESTHPTDPTSVRPETSAEDSSIPPHAVRTARRAIGRTGTPAYMAPEQRRDGTANARSDQYSYCVAIQEALSGAPPEAGTPFSDAQISPKDLGAPAWLYRTIGRGLSFDPAQRYASMDGLIDVLVSEPRRRRRMRRAAPITAGALILLVAGALWGNARSRATSGQLCRGAERKLVGIWDQDQQNAVRSAFLATGKPFADDALRGVDKTLDEYTSRWVKVRTETCEETRVQGSQSERMLDLRMACLDERLAAVGALTNGFVHAGSDVVVRAFTAAQSLPTLAACSDPKWLEARVKPSEDPQVRAKVEGIREELARETVVEDLGKYTEALDLARATTLEATEAGDPSLLPEVLYHQGALLGRTSDFAGAEATLKRAAALADAAGDDATRVGAFGALLYYSVGQAGKVDDLAQYRTSAEAALTRLGSNPRVEAKYLQDLASALLQVGNFPEAIEAQKRATVLLESAFGKESWQVAASLMNLGISHATAGEGAEALAIVEPALASEAQSLGSSHPYIASGEATVAWALLEQNKPELAEPHARRAIAIGEETLGDDELARIVGMLGDVLAEQKNYEAALPVFERALSLTSRAHPGDNPVIRSQLTSVGETYLALGKPSVALPYLERAVALPAAGEEAAAARAQFYLASCLSLMHGDRKRARSLALAARETMTRLAAGNPDDLLTEINEWLAHN
jgi:tetratricopeptide (TPR) repeat protein